MGFWAAARDEPGIFAPKIVFGQREQRFRLHLGDDGVLSGRTIHDVPDVRRTVSDQVSHENSRLDIGHRLVRVVVVVAIGWRETAEAKHLPTVIIGR